MLLLYTYFTNKSKINSKNVVFLLRRFFLASLGFKFCFQQVSNFIVQTLNFRLEA